MARAVVVDLDGELGALDADGSQKLVGGRERLDRRNRLAHPAEADPVLLALEPHRNGALAGLEHDLRELERRGEHEGGPEDWMAGEGQLVHGREDADPRVAARLGRVDVDRLGEVQLAGERLQGLFGELARVGEDGEAVALERRVREDVREYVAKGRHCAQSRIRGPSSCAGVINFAHAADGEIMMKVASPSRNHYGLLTRAKRSSSKTSDRMRWRLAFLVLVLALAHATPALAGRIYWGARIAGPVYGVGDAPFDWKAVDKFTASTHKKPSIIHFYAPFAHDCDASGCSFYPFNKEAFQRVRQHGMIPMLSWNSASMPLTKLAARFSESGHRQRSLRLLHSTLGEGSEGVGPPVLPTLQPGDERTWFPWSPGVNGNTAADFVAAWRHVHRIFENVGARNATWVWCPNVDPDHDFVGFRKLYPGGRYVDWTCLDGYNFPTDWRSFSSAYRRSYRVSQAVSQPHKPMIIGEVASTELGGSKASWIRDMLGTQLAG